MRLRERKQVDYIEDTVLETEPFGETYKSWETTSSRSKDPAFSSSSDEIEASEGEERQNPDTISDDSSNPDDELPVASKVTGRIRYQRQKTRKNRHGLSSGDDDFCEGGGQVAKNAAPANSLLKYLKANVSNVADPPMAPNAGSESDDAFEAAPPALQAGRRKRKVVAEPRGGRVRERRFKTGSLDSSDEDNHDPPEQVNPKNQRDNIKITRMSTRALRESKVSYKEVSSSDEESEAARNIPVSHASMMSDVRSKDTSPEKTKVEDSPDLDIFALKMEKDPTKKRGENVAETFTNGPLKCYSRKTRVQSAVKPAQKLESKEDVHAHDGERRSQISNRAAKNLKESSSDEDGSGAEDVPIASKKAGSPLKKLRRLSRVRESEKNCSKFICQEAVSEDEDFPKEISLPKVQAHERPIIMKAGVYGIVREDHDGPMPVAKRIGQVEKILSVRRTAVDTSATFCVKEYQKSYRNVVNVKEELLLKHCPQLMRNFLKRMTQLGRVDGHCHDNKDSPAFDPLFTKIDRIIAQEVHNRNKSYLVKWCRLPYSEATWEKEEHLRKDQVAIFRFHQFNLKAIICQPQNSSKKVFKDGRALRDYQEAGVAWLDHNFENRTNCVLADEMGLGKTIQSVAMLENLRTKRKIRGPFLVIAPVSTLGHWQREVESLTDMNCVVYTGNQEDRDIIREYEFYYSDGKSQGLKFTVLLTSFEMLMKDQNKFAKETWQYIVVDEAHRLKSKDSKTTQALRQLHVRNGGLLLLTGTPVQNNTKEIFSLLNLLDPGKFNSEEEFLEKYGEIKDAEQIKDIQNNILRPRLLRRMKEDVEKSIPQKEETIVWVELTRDQRAFYQAIFENNIASLLKGSTSHNMPNLRNVAMELRKICNHPFLCDGLEANLISKHGASKGGDEVGISGKLLTQSSGKMILVDKLLPKLKDAGRRVLIFSQFTIMLDLLEDYLVLKGYKYERIDGKIRGSDRQAAIDRYSAKDSDIFVFLLSTRAGGLGITLTAADTCIIYDSDWNPQNDLQAMARCHRIGQTKDVKIYRLITRNTYEQRLFECSSRKYGLDEAILGNRLGADVDIEHNKNIESLLKHGAYDMLKDDGEQAAAEFTTQDIDQILEQRTQQRQIGGRGNNTFSVATFVSNPDAESEWAKENILKPDQDSKEFWQELMPEACERAVAEAMAAEAPAPLHPGGLRKRTRGRVDYRENAQLSGEISSDKEGAARSKKGRGKRDGSTSIEVQTSDEEDEIDYWSEKEIKRLEDRLFSLGPGRTEQIREEARLEHRSIEEIEEVSEALIHLCRDKTEDCKTATLDLPKTSLAKERNQAGALTSPSQIRDTDGQGASPGNQCAPEDRKEYPSICGKVKSQQPSLRSGEESGTPGGDDPPEELSTVVLELEKPISQKILAVLERVIETPAFKDRIHKNASRYLQQFHERQILAQALQSQPIEYMHVPYRSKKLPSWWGEQEDEDLLKAAHMYGQKDYKKIKSDSNLSFVKRIAGSTSLCLDVEMPPKEESTVQVGEDKDTMPSDAVLASRLKKLIESLPHGLSTWAVNKKAVKAEVSRKLKAEQRAEQRKLSGKFFPEADKKKKPEITKKSLANWVSPTLKNESKTSAELHKIVNCFNSRREKETTKSKVPAPRKKKLTTKKTCTFQSPESETPESLPAAMSPCSSFQNSPPTSDNAKHLQDDTTILLKKPLQTSQIKVATNCSRSKGQKPTELEDWACISQQRAPKENEVPKRKKLSLSLSSSAFKKQKEDNGKQTQRMSALMMSFLKPKPLSKTIPFAR